jgi:tetratricopeptide (TPR) repeat protein
MVRSALTALIVLLSLTAAVAQRRPGPTSRPTTVELTVRLLYDDSRQASEPYRVQLMSGIGMPVSETYSDSRGEARFGNVSPGSYRVKVSGIGIEETNSETFVVQSFSTMAFQMVTVKRVADASAAGSAGPPVSAAELSIPDKARKEYQKGLTLLDKKDYEEAIKRFEKAAEIYPRYAAALDAIGVARAKTSPAQAKSDFQKAVDADRQYTPAYVHLARVYMTENDFTNGEKLLQQALPQDPRSAEMLFLMAYAQLKLKKYDAAIESMERTHQLEHEKYTLVHFVAGEAYALSGRNEQAIAQYSLYLKESPLGPNAESAKTNIQQLQMKAASK